MATPKLSPQDRKDLDKFTKYLVYKCAQIIIQSRSGEKVNSQSKLVSSGTDWFNLSIRDDPEIQSEIRNIYGNCSLMDGQKVCFEISMKTLEGKETVLETWYLETNDYCDPTSRVSCTVYSRMGVLLKSLLIATRAVPGYRVSREQGTDRYVMCYQIYLGLPKFDSLGDNYVKHTVGLVSSPVGTIALYVAYRAKKNLSVRYHLADVLAKDFRDNYYRPESVPHSKSDLCCARNDPETVRTDTRRRSVGDILTGGEALKGSYRMDFDNNGTKHSPGTVAGKEVAKSGPHVSEQDNMPYLNSTATPIKALEIERADSNGKKEEINHEKCGSDAFPIDGDSRNTSLKRSLQPMVVASSSSASDHSSPSAASAPDDFVVLEMKTPFTEDGRDEAELGKFYNECKAAPPLSMFQKSTDLQEMLNCITDQLAQFEANAKDFDEFVNSITEEIN